MCPRVTLGYTEQMELDFQGRQRKREAKEAWENLLRCYRGTLEAGQVETQKGCFSFRAKQP